MESILLEGTSHSPAISCNADTGVIEIKGRSIMPNAVEFYKPINDWLAAHSLMPQKNTQVDIKLEYFNTSSSKCLLDIFKKLKLIVDSDNKVEINWYHKEDDEDMIEAGEDYEDIINIPFKFIETEE